MSAFTITVDDAAVRATLQRLADSARNPKPALSAIGKRLYAMTRRTFETSTDPWGRSWVPNKPATLARKRGTKPLIGAGKFLSGPSLNYNVAGNTLTLGSSAVYAAMQQFGGTKSAFPHLWGDIPARPFLPITSAGELAPAAQRVVIDTIEEYLQSLSR